MSKVLQIPEIPWTSLSAAEVIRLVCQSIPEQSQAGDTVWLPLYKSVMFAVCSRCIMWLAILCLCLICTCMHVTAVFRNFVHMTQDWRPECRNALVSAAATLLWDDSVWFTVTKSDRWVSCSHRRSFNKIFPSILPHQQWQQLVQLHMWMQFYALEPSKPCGHLLLSDHGENHPT